MSTVGYGRLKHHPGYPAGSREGGNVVHVLRRSGAQRRPPAEGDTALVRQALLLQLAMKALDRIIADYSGLTQRRPSYAALARYLEDLERGPQPAPARAADAPTRSSSTTETPALLQPSFGAES
jgi:hypothetical protein